ncbi:MAG TPA: phospholipid carrier-dependent glycosyltransferase [Candidatus Saccharimonadales bacterium]|nr:phospholipid carrier-dependent glycosyltransferase [Candidatus Saccharimonadales bacterium]
MRRNKIVFGLLLVLTLCGILRSAIATRLDSFDLDEAYHITAGATYVRLGDYRLNPEHPPLMKLWVGAFLTPAIMKTPKLRPMAEKWDERHFTETVVFTENNPDVVQRRARIAMFALNGILMLSFALAVWRAFGSEIGPLMSVGALAFLVIDPTIAAHLPVVLTDLPVALLGATSVLLAWSAFRWGKTIEIILAGLALGLTLGAKHTGVIVGVAVAVLGMVAVFKNARGSSRWRCLGQVFAVLVLAWITLWGLYRFRFNESPVGLDLFNRPLATKIADLHSPLLRSTVALMVRTHLLPRSYLWGLADILHVGVEGRVIPVFFLGKLYVQRPPFYFFPAVILLKVPLGLMTLSLAGIVLLFASRPWPGKEPLLVILLFGALLLAMLMKGTSSYAGMRHALIVLPSLAVAGAAALSLASERRSRSLFAGIAIATLLALVSAIPVLRPWEYYNELVGGKDNAWQHLADESTDSGQRTKEIAAYYHQVLEPKGEIPYIEYWESSPEDRWRRVPSMQALWKAQPETDTSDVVTGTVIVSACYVQSRPLSDLIADYSPLLTTKSVQRFGNVLIFRGTFLLPSPRASRLFYRALDAEYSETPDLAKAELFLSRSLDAKPKVFSRWIEFGNVLMARGKREEAVRAYQNARLYVPEGDEIIVPLNQQIQRVAQEDLKSLSPLRNPELE